MASVRVVGLLLAVLTCCSVFLEVSACAGCVQLTEYTFDKILGKFDATLVKFDVAFPYGDKHEAYSDLAKDAKLVDELLVAEVGIKDYGERDNEEIAERFSIKKDDYPVVKLFVRNKKRPIAFPKDEEFTSDNLRRFVKQNTGIHMSLPGCLPRLDTIVFKFMKAEGDDRKPFLKEAESVTSKLSDSLKPTGKIYQQIMQKVIEKGDSFVTGENERVKKLLEGKISPEKKKELNNKLNILLSFSEKIADGKIKDEF